MACVCDSCGGAACGCAACGSTAHGSANQQLVDMKNRHVLGVPNSYCSDVQNSDL